MKRLSFFGDSLFTWWGRKDFLFVDCIFVESEYLWALNN